jgi:hypothetical protein
MSTATDQPIYMHRRDLGAVTGDEFPDLGDRVVDLRRLYPHRLVDDDELLRRGRGGCRSAAT